MGARIFAMGLKRPDGLGDLEWLAITDAEERLLRAKAADDRALVVGSSKELCEAIAKIVITQRGSLAAAGADLPELITMAHRLLDFQPGEGLATEPEARKIAQSLKSMVLGVGEMRNRHGTGHGRAVPSGITAEHAELAFDSAMLWSGWAVRRLEPYIAGDVSALVRDLEANTFRKGDLGRRLGYAGLSGLSVEDQWRLGFAVACRASRGTFVVMADGVSAVRAEDDTAWPRAYVEGLITGLLFDVNGYLDITDWKAREIARLIAALREPESLLRGLATKAMAAALGGAVSGDEDGRKEAGTEFHRAAAVLPAGEVRDLWNRLAGIIESDMEELAELDLARRLQEADSKAGWEGPEQQYSGGDAVRDYEGEPIEYHPSSDDDMRPRGS